MATAQWKPCGYPLSEGQWCIRPRGHSSWRICTVRNFCKEHGRWESFLTTKFTYNPVATSSHSPKPIIADRAAWPMMVCALREEVE